MEGRVIANRAGFGFLRVEGRTESIFLPPREMAGLMHGDRVRVHAVQAADGRWSGEVRQVVERGVESFLATVDMHGRHASVQAADRRLALYCQVPLDQLGGAKQGDWVIARVLKYPQDGRVGVARVTQVLDPERPVTLAIEAAIAKSGLPTGFPVDVQQEADAFGKTVDAAEAGRRVDLRGLPLVTIDGEDAKDFDDAVYAEPAGKGWRLVVAIADVSHYVREGTALDESARSRGTSVYFPGRVLPMLPHALSDQLCSLQPHVDRLCLVADMQVSPTGLLKSSRFYPAVMRSAARLTYGQAFDALFEGRPEARQRIGPLVDRLLPLVDLYRVLAKARGRRGALDFEAPEARFAIDAAEHISAIQLPLRNDAHKLIEECMVLANVAAARALAEAGIPTLYRVHAEPDPQKLDTLTTTLRALGIGLDLPPEVSTRDLQKIAPRIKDPAARPFIETLVVRSLMQAAYQPENIGHFGLALQHYAHFTSPIRRYPDLLVHRALKAKVDSKDTAGRVYTAAEMQLLGEQTTALEKRADESDRYVDTFLKAVYLRDRIGQTFDGLITSVTDFGCFVQILEAATDGLLHMQNLHDDEYIKEDDQTWVGLQHKRRLRLGERLRVVVTAVNPVEGLVDLDLALEPAPPARNGKSRRNGKHG
ncbi:MAG: ribonuclease [Pseudomonadota bacterium]